MRSGLTSMVMAMGVMLAMVQVATAQGVATPGASPVAGSDWNMETAAGSAFDLLTPAPGGTVDIVTVGALEDESLPVIIHNNTDVPIDSARVQGVVLDAEGRLVIVAQAAVMEPDWIAPQGIAMGALRIEQPAIPDGATLEMLVEYDSPAERDTFGSLEPVITEWNWAQGRVLGIITNPHDQEITEPRVIVSCIAADGSIQSSTRTTTSANVIPVGGTVAFQVMPGDGPPCAGELIVADGRT